MGPRRSSTTPLRVACIILTAILFAPVPCIVEDATAQFVKDAEPFPDFRMGPQNLGYVRADLPPDNRTLWVTRFDSMVASSPVVSAGRVYVGTMGGQVLCLSATTGAVLWEVGLGSGVESTAAVVNGSVFIGADDGLLRCLDARTGVEMWNFSTRGAIKSSPTVVDGRVFIGSNDFSVYCLDASTGAQLWNLSTGSYVFSSPAYLDGRIYFGSCDGRVYCVLASNGTVNWTFQAQYAPASPAVFAGGVVIGTYDKTFYQLDRLTGEVIYSMITRSEVYSSACVNPDTSPALLCTCDNDGNIYFMQGASAFTSPVDFEHGPVSSSPILFGGYMGTGLALVIATKTGQLVAYEYYRDPHPPSTRYLEEIWRLRLGTSITSTPFSYHGRLYVGAEDDDGGLVACIGVLGDEGRITVTSPLDGTHLYSPVNVSFIVEGTVVDSAEVVADGIAHQASEVGGIWHVGVPLTIAPGPVRLLVRAKEADVTVAETSIEVNLRERTGIRPTVTITRPGEEGRVSGTFLASGTARSDPKWPVLMVELGWDGEGGVYIAVGTSDWTVAVNASDLGEGRHTLVVRAFDGLFWGEASVDLMVDNDRSLVVGLSDVVAVVLLLAVVVALMLTRPRPPPKPPVPTSGPTGKG